MMGNREGNDAIGFRQSEQINWHRLEALKDALAESDLPIRVDNLDWQALTPSFRAIIEENYEVIQRGKSE